MPQDLPDSKYIFTVVAALNTQGRSWTASLIRSIIGRCNLLSSSRDIAQYHSNSPIYTAHKSTSVLYGKKHGIYLYLVNYSTHKHRTSTSKRVNLHLRNDVWQIYNIYIYKNSTVRLASVGARSGSPQLLYWMNAGHCKGGPQLVHILAYFVLPVVMINGKWKK